MTASAFAELFTSDLAAEVRGEFDERVGFGRLKDAPANVFCIDARVLCLFDESVEELTGLARRQRVER